MFYLCGAPLASAHLGGGQDGVAGMMER